MSRTFDGSAVQPPAAPANAAGGGAAPGAERTEISRAVAATGGVATFKAGTETVVLKVVLQPGGSTGRHSHYDGGMFLINKGVVTSYGLDSPLWEARRATGRLLGRPEVIHDGRSLPPADRRRPRGRLRTAPI